MRLLVPAATLALALVLTGCSDGDDGDAAPVQASPTTATSDGSGDGGSYATTADIVAALGENGLPCAEPMTGTYPGVAEAQSCVLNDAEDVVLLRFATSAEKEGYLSTKDELASAVVGEDWAVQTVLPQTAEQVAAALGGELVLGEGGEQPSS